MDSRLLLENTRSSSRYRRSYHSFARKQACVCKTSVAGSDKGLPRQLLLSWHDTIVVVIQHRYMSFQSRLLSYRASKDDISP